MNCAQGQMIPMYVWSVVLKSLHTTNLADKLWVEQNQPQYKRRIFFLLLPLPHL